MIVKVIQNIVGDNGLIFKKGKTIDFSDNITVIVGSNGSGKTTLLSNIKKTINKDIQNVYLSLDTDYTVLSYIETEDNVHRQMPGTVKTADLMLVLRKSAGEGQHSTIMNLFNNAEKIHNKGKKLLILLDEVDRGFDMKSQCLFPNILHNISEFGKVICSTHCMSILQSTLLDKVYDMDSQQYVKRIDYYKQLIESL